ncbi:MAG: DUF1499 domain-containing protein [bacterium]
MFQRIRWMLTENHVTTDGTPPYPDLNPLEVSGTRTRVLERCKEAFLAGGPNWNLLRNQGSNRKIRGIVTTPLFQFRDRFTVWLENTDQTNSWKIMARSRAEIGIADFGKNARNIRTFYQNMKDLT